MQVSNEILLDFMKTRPALYEQSPYPFWDDEHISKNMLQAHLAPDFDGASRKHDFIKKSVAWLESRLAKGTLLDLGCGPGIYASLLADKGFSVTGIDFSKRSIDYAKADAAAHNRDIKYFYQNYLDLDYSAEFDSAIMVYCDFGVLSPENRRMLLNKTYRALKPGGRLILDAWNTEYLTSYKQAQSISYSDGGFFSPGPHVLIEQDIIYADTANTLEKYLIVTENDCKHYYTWNQAYTPATLESEFAEAGFKNCEFFDDVSGADFTGSLDTLCIAAAK